jgi:hypothetical protein
MSIRRDERGRHVELQIELWRDHKVVLGEPADTQGESIVSKGWQPQQQTTSSLYEHMLQLVLQGLTKVRAFIPFQGREDHRSLFA